MALNFNVSPYYDDFDPNKNFHRILFKPGFAVQARELTQSQTILQDQVSKFADSIFAKNTPISGGKLTLNTSVNYLKLNPTQAGILIDVNQFVGQLIQNANGDILAKVVAVAAATTPTTGTPDPDTLIVSYLSGSNFAAQDTIYTVNNQNISATIITDTGTNYPVGKSSIASISDGVFYVVNGYNTSATSGTNYSIGNFVNVLSQTAILDKYDSVPNLRVGLNIVESVQTYVDDISLLDPADGSPNFQGPGADRYVISLQLVSLPLALGGDNGFIELMRLEGGQIKKQVDGSVYSTIDDYFAKRTFDTNGNYVVNDFKLTPSANISNNGLYDLKVGKGVAYVKGYRLENQSDLTLTSNRARTTNSIQNDSTFMEYGNYFFIDTINGFFDASNIAKVDLHITPSANIAQGTSNTYNSTVAGTSRVRNVEYVAGSSSDTSTYVYKVFLMDIESSILTGNCGLASANTVIFNERNPGDPLRSSANGAYVGTTITVDYGPSQGDTRKVIAYDGVMKKITVDSPFTVVPTTESILSLHFNIAAVNSIAIANTSYDLLSSGNINALSKNNGQLTGLTQLSQPGTPELIYSIGYPYTATVSNTFFQTTREFKSVSFSTTGQISLSGGEPFQFSAANPSQYIIINNATNQIVPMTDIVGISVDAGQKTATVTVSGGSIGMQANIIAPLSTTNASDNGYILKIKNLIYGNTSNVYPSGTSVDANNFVDLINAQTYIKSGGFVSAGQPQSLYVSDVKRIVKIIDTKGAPLLPNLITDSSYDISRNYSFDNGQTDNYYNHASIKLLPGRPVPTGNLVVIYDYYDHKGGDGYFSVESYLAAADGGVSNSPENYASIPSYTAKDGTSYQLRDSIDFRPKVMNATNVFQLDGKNTNFYIPVDGSLFVSDYSYYLARKDLLVLSKDKSFQIVSGTPDINPLYPTQPDGSLLVANLSLDPYTAYVPSEVPNGLLPNLSIEYVKHKRWTMSDISDLQTRVNNIEYYTALNNLEKSAQTQQVPDVNGLNRFKNGILVDDFSSFATADSTNSYFNASINRRERKLTASQVVDNFPLQSPWTTASLNNLDNASEETLGVSIHNLGHSNIFTLPYTSANLASQTLASSVINVNPYATPIYQGVVSLTPPMDNWVDNTKQPDLLIVDPNLQLYQSSNTINALSAGDWKVIPGTQTSSSTSVSQVNHGAYVGVFGSVVGQTTTTTKTYASSSQTTTLGYYDNLGSSYSTNNGYITDISILPYIRSQQLLIRANGLLVNTPISTWFDGINVNQYIHSPDIIELNNPVGTFNVNDTIGYYDNNAFNPIATVVAVYYYPNAAKVRLSVVSNYHTSYVGEENISIVQNATFDINGNYVGTTAHGTITTTNIISVHKTGTVTGVGGSYIDAASNNVRYYKVYTNHGAFADKYSIWGSPKATGNLPDGTFDFTVPVTGLYYPRVSTDDAQSGTIKINGVTVWTSSLQSGSYNDLAAVTLTAGTNTVEFSMTTSQDDGDAYVAFAIAGSPWTGPTTPGHWNYTQVQSINNGKGQPTNAKGQPINNYKGNTGVTTTTQAVWVPGTVPQLSPSTVFDTGSLTFSSPPTNVGAHYRFTGGGDYYTGVTQFTLSGIASDITDFYVGSQIKVNTTFVSFNPLTGAAKTETQSYSSTIVAYTAATRTVYLASPGINVSEGYNNDVNGSITSTYTIDGTETNYKLTAINGGLSKLSTDENGNFVGIFNIPANTFKTGDRVFRVDNRIVASDPTTATSYAEATFTASGLSTKSQAIDFSPSIDSAAGTFTQTSYKANQLVNTVVTYTPYDPVAQTFIVDKTNFPNGSYLTSLKVFFATKPTTTNAPITLSIVGTTNGYPNGAVLDYSTVTLTSDLIKTSTTPHYLDSNTFTEFVFSAPVYIQSGVLYAFMLKSPSDEYTLYYAAQNGTAISSSVKNLPSDPTPSTITKIGTAPYVGSLFESQNALTWTADQGKALMFVLDRCVFDTTKSPRLPFVTPRGLPYRKLTTQDIKYYYDANTISSVLGTVAPGDVYSDAYNLTTTDFVPTSTSINYSYRSTLNDAIHTVTSESPATPGKYGSPTYDNIYLNDGLGQRVLVANSDTSFVMYGTMNSVDDAVSPIISDDGISLYNILSITNNMPIYGASVTIANGGTGYNVSSMVVSVSAPDSPSGTQAYATANVDANGIIQNLVFSDVGSGYFTTPEIIITDSTTRFGNTDVSLIVQGETSPTGGNAATRYMTKKVVLPVGNDSGDLRVYYTAYRPFGSDVLVYYKILNRNDTMKFENAGWQLMTTLSSSNVYSKSQSDMIEYECAPGMNNVADDAISYLSTNGTTYTSFSQFAIKIVISASDSTNVPFLTDIRALALPSGTGL